MKPSVVLLNIPRIGVILTLLCLGPGTVSGQTIRNGGTINNTAPISCTTFQNWKNASAGILNNTSTVTVTGSAASSFDNNNGGSQANNNAGGSIVLSNTGSTYANGAGATANNTATSTLRLAGAITNGTGSITTTNGKIEYNGTAQTVFAGVVGSTYGTLKVSGNGASLLGGSVTVGSALDLSTGAGSLSVNGSTLTLNGTVSTGGTSLIASSTGSTTIYGGTGTQNVVASTYYNLTVQGTGQKSVLGAVAVSNSLSLPTANDSLDFAANTFTLNSGATVTSLGKLKASGTVSVPALNPTIGGTFVYYGATQTLAGANYTNLVLRGTGSFTMPGTDTVAVSGSYAMEGTPTRTYASNNTFTYNGSGAQSILGGASDSYYRLIMSGATDTSSSNYKTVTGGNVVIANNGGFVIQGITTVNMGSNSISFGAAHSDSVQGGSKIMWAANNVYIPGNGTTEFYGASAANVAAGANYGNLLFTGSGVKTIPAATAVTAIGGTAGTGVYVVNNLTIASTGSLTVTGMDLNNDGTITNNGSITVQ